jgi:hypothetical protein
MRDNRLFARPCLLAAAVLLFFACLPPIAFHDGLPAWSPQEKDVEWRLGYQHLSAFDADTFELFGEEFARPDFSISYFTPGVRWGLRQSPVAADVGIASVISAGGGGVSVQVAPTFGVGHCDKNYSVMFRPSVYLFSLNLGDETEFQLTPWIQGELLVGNGYRAKGMNFAAGGRASPLAAGPIGFVGVSVHPVDIRAEVSYMWPMSFAATGKALTIGLTAAAPTKR